MRSSSCLPSPCAEPGIQQWGPDLRAKEENCKTKDHLDWKESHPQGNSDYSLIMSKFFSSHLSFSV